MDTSQALSTNAPPPTASQTTPIETPIPSSLKFIVSNIKNVIHTQLLPDNYPTWQTQVHKMFLANSFAGFTTGKFVATGGQNPSVTMKIRRKLKISGGFQTKTPQTVIHASGKNNRQN
ncbi:hypothetical protein IEQ34_019003 [Dendrobium chrysotoxum]|uniref:Retrotransposon Copia-like N-terminal domain-containing protein n=1 Tax=Dendrobium chrysotoxum TaxID=161865 RepID=A0AAV7G6U1_DENCH|nr:hypothetical protein IEQ34_019003 [Dendrobium chrysotoxum]